MLIELASESYASIVPFFGPTHPNYAFVHGVLEKKLPGRVWAVPAERGFSACLLATEASFCFAAGALDPETLDEMLALLAARPPFTLIYPPALDVARAASKYGLEVGERRQFGAAKGEDPGCQGLEAPPPFERVRIDGDLYLRSNWKEAVHRIFGPAESYLENHYGFGLLLDGQLIAEAHGVVGGGHVEIGAYTLEAYRRTGLSNVVCAEVKKHGAKLGHRPVTTCDAERAGSIAISYRIGLRDELRYRVLQPRK